jgi:O-acetyl-ADP-ribose deacetylase (regulator of RNase III)
MTPTTIKLSEITHQGTFTASVNQADSTKARLIYNPTDGGPQRQWDVQLINGDTHATVLTQEQAKAIANLFSEEAFKTALLDAKRPAQPNAPSLQINASQNGTDGWKWSLDGSSAEKTVANPAIIQAFQSVFPKGWEQKLPKAPLTSPPPLAAAAASSSKGSSTGWPKAQVFKGGVTSVKAEARISSDTHCFTEMKRFGGAADIVHEIMQKNSGAKCGVMIAANSGLPCGAVGNDGGTKALLNARTQEESVVANALLTQFGPDTAQHKDVIKSALDRVWGMTDGPIGTSTMTHQGIDFTKSENPHDYNQTYVLKGCQLSAIKEDSKGEKELTPGTQHPVTLFFADSVNANPKNGTANGTMQRTLNALSIDDYDFFVECIKTKLRSSLDGMIAEGITHPILAKLSCGIYAGEHIGNIKSDFTRILQEVLTEPVPGGKSGLTRRACFAQVILADVCGKDAGKKDTGVGKFISAAAAPAAEEDGSGRVGGLHLAGGGGGGSAASASVPRMPDITMPLEGLPVIADLHSYTSPTRAQMPQAQRVKSPVDHLVMNWKQHPDVNITIRKQDIFESGAQVIVNAANTSLGGGGGIDGAIHTNGGQSYAREHDKLRTGYKGAYPQGFAAIIPSGDLAERRAIQKVIVVAAPKGDSKRKEAHGDLLAAHNKEDALYSCYFNSLCLAELQEHTSIAFPSLGTGEFAYPVQEAAPIALKAIYDFLESRRDLPLRPSIKTISIHFLPTEGDEVTLQPYINACSRS